VLRRFSSGAGRACVPSRERALPAASGVSLVRVDRLEQSGSHRSVLVLRRGPVLLVRRALAPMRGAWEFPEGSSSRRDGRAGRPRELREEAGIASAWSACWDHPDVYGGSDPLAHIYFVAGVRGDGAPCRRRRRGGLRLVLPPGAPPPAGFRNTARRCGSSSGPRRALGDAASAPNVSS